MWTCSSGTLDVKGRRAPSRQLEGDTGPGLVFKGEKAWPRGAPRGMLTTFTVSQRSSPLILYTTDLPSPSISTPAPTVSSHSL